MDLQKVNKFVPKTQTVNADRLYFINEDKFIKQDFNIERGKNEAAFLKPNKHLYMQEYIDSYTSNESHFLVTEFFNGETLENLELDKAQKIKIVSQLLELYSFMLKKSIIHGDINVSNILFDGRNIKLIDWETASIGQNLKDLTGPPWGILDLIKKYLT